MSDKLTIAEPLAAIAEEVRRIEAVDWIDDPHEILASMIRMKSWRALKQRGLSAKATKRSGDGAVRPRSGECLQEACG